MLLTIVLLQYLLKKKRAKETENRMMTRRENNVSTNETIESQVNAIILITLLCFFSHRVTLTVVNFETNHNSINQIIKFSSGKVKKKSHKVN